MPLVRVELDVDRERAKKVFERYRSGRTDRELQERATAAVWARGHTPIDEPRFVGLTHGEPRRVVFDVEVDRDVDR